MTTVVEALSAVMGDVQAIKKTDQNRQQGFTFRGVDAVVNAVGPALRKHGVVVTPIAEDIEHDYFDSKGGARMHHVTARVRWRFHGPDGDHIEAVTYGESADAGDKATAKAHSVAYRIALLQALCIPTDEPDPDHSVYERAPEITTPPEVTELHRQIIDVGAQQEKDRPAVAADFAAWSQGGDVRTASVEQLRAYLEHLRGTP